MRHSIPRLRTAVALALMAALGPWAWAQDLLVTSNREAGIFQLYHLHQGGALRRVTPASMEVSDVALSPDGTRAAFVSYDKGMPDLYVVMLDSGQTRRLTQDGAKISGVVWSPDGQRIAFQSMRDKTPKIHAVPADGGTPRRLTTDNFEEASPSFSPDGRQIAYIRIVGRKESQVRVIEAAGGASRAISPEPAKTLETGPTWSPDGQSLAWSSHDDKRRIGRIFVARADGSQMRAVSSDAGKAGQPAWSPDSRQISFLAVRDPSIRQALYVVGADGRGERELSAGLGESLSARWSPDGGQIYFVRFERGGGRIFGIRADGSGERELLGAPGYHAALEVMPARRPVRTALLSDPAR
jgi:Tol biopolymer transport system component